MVTENRPHTPAVPRPWLLWMVVVLTLAACTEGGASPQILVDGDECGYEGQSEIPAGEVATVLQLRSLGHNAVALLAIDQGRTYAEVVSHYETHVESIPLPPDWTDQVVYFELLHESGEAVGDSRTVVLEPGSYAVVCVDFWGFAAEGPTAFPVAEVVVTDG